MMDLDVGDVGVCGRIVNVVVAHDLFCKGYGLIVTEIIRNTCEKDSYSIENFCRQILSSASTVNTSVCKRFCVGGGSVGVG